MHSGSRFFWLLCKGQPPLLAGHCPTLQAPVVMAMLFVGFLQPLGQGSGWCGSQRGGSVGKLPPTHHAADWAFHTQGFLQVDSREPCSVDAFSNLPPAHPHPLPPRDTKLRASSFWAGEFLRFCLKKKERALRLLGFFSFWNENKVHSQINYI